MCPHQARHPSIAALCKEESAADPIIAVEARIDRFMTSARDLGLGPPPYNPELLASLEGLRVREDPAMRSYRGQEALLSGDIIVLSPGLSDNRRRFAVAHEIIHRLLGETSGDTTSEQVAELEWICQAGAGMLLMPRQDLNELLPMSYERIVQTSMRFSVSIEAAGRRLAARDHEGVFVIVQHVDDLLATRPDAAAHIEERGCKNDDLAVVTWVPAGMHGNEVGKLYQPVPRKSCLRTLYFRAKQGRSRGSAIQATEDWLPSVGIMVDAGLKPRTGRVLEILAVLRPSTTPCLPRAELPTGTGLM